LGYYSITLRHDQASMSGGFNVEEYKKPEYQGKVRPEKTRVLPGEAIRAAIEANYNLGEPLAGAKIKYAFQGQPSYSSFGDQDNDDSEGYAGYQEGGEDSQYYDYGSEQQSEQSSVLDADGHLTVTISTKASPNKRDIRYRIEARVMDASNREIS